ncbi:MAG: LUD domain-containing protein [Bacteroidota bacterium]
MKVDILRHIRANKAHPLPLPEYTAFSYDFNPQEKFIELMGAVGGKVLLQKEPLTLDQLSTLFGEGKSIYSGIDDINSHVEVSKLKAHELHKIELVILPAQIAVAENGACYLDESVLPHRVLPFICQHLILVIDAHSIVGNMHEAMEKIDLSKEGFSIFIAGPSKTADIEQSLVIGAQGARSLTVFIKN